MKRQRKTPDVVFLEELRLELGTERRRQHLTQADVANMAKISLRTVTRIEHGDPNVAIKYYLRVIAALSLLHLFKTRLSNAD